MTIHRSFAVALATMALAACDQLTGLAQGGSSIRDDGAYVLLAVDAAALQQQQLETTADRMAEMLRAASPAIRFTGRGVLDNAARIRLIDNTDAPRARAALAALGADFAITEGERGVLEARLTPTGLRRLSEMSATRSIEVLQHRMGQTAAVTPYSNGRVLVRTNASVVDPALHPRLTTTALMTFHMVRETTPEQTVLPAGTMLVAPYPEVGHQQEVVDRRPRFTGERLARVTAGFDRVTGERQLIFALDDEGARVFCRITRENTGHRFAVLLDNMVLTAPTINEPICGGSGIISGSFSREELEELVTVLNAGALPTPLTIVAEGVGPAP